MRIIYICLLSGLFLGSEVAGKDLLQIGTLTAEPGQMVSGFLEVPDGVDKGTRIPVTVFNGKGDGPVLALVAGNHGYEYSPILALQRLRARLDPAHLKGAVIMVHVANLPSFLGRTVYYSPIDGKNLNRVYPGKADGTVSERIAYAVTKEAIERCDYLVDLHCGDGNESLRPYTYWTDSGNPRVDEPSREMALAFGLDHLVIDRDRPRDPNQSVYCANTGTTRGKPAMTTESGGLGRTDDEESIRSIEEGVVNLMRHLKILEGQAARVEHPVWIDQNQVLRSEATGVFHPAVKKGHTVARGTLIGTITDFFGNPVAEVRSPFDGVILYVVATPPINAGEPLAMVGTIRRP